MRKLLVLVMSLILTGGVWGQAVAQPFAWRDEGRLGRASWQAHIYEDRQCARVVVHTRSGSVQFQFRIVAGELRGGWRSGSERGGDADIQPVRSCDPGNF